MWENGYNLGFRKFQGVMQMQRVFSGIQPTGKIHLGNYLGAVRNWVDLEEQFENIFCIVNSHAITTTQDPKELRGKTYELANMLLACGIHPKKSHIFIQSEVEEHPALAWILDCNIAMGEMSRMTQYKDKSQKNPKNINVGLFNYPALMAADILLYQADLVPVGEDQKQHLELTRNVAQKFNRDFGECFKIPEPMIPKIGARVMGLDDPSVKMSKSHTGANHAIFLMDTPEEILKKFKKATTDSEGIIAFDENRPGVYNLLCMYETFSGLSRDAIERHFDGKGYGDLKKEVAELVISALTPIKQRYKELANDMGYVEKILSEGRDRARQIASVTYKKAKELIGLI